MLVGFVKAWCQFDSFMTSLYLVAELNKRMIDGEEVSNNVVEPKTTVPLFNRCAIFLVFYSCFVRFWVLMNVFNTWF